MKKSATAIIPSSTKTNNNESEIESKDDIKDKSHDSAVRGTSESSSESDDDDENIEPGKNLAKILRSVSKASTGQDDTKMLKNLVSVGRSAQHARAGQSSEENENLSSKDLLSSIANSAVARRRNLKER